MSRSPLESPSPAASCTPLLTRFPRSSPRFGHYFVRWGFRAEEALWWNHLLFAVIPQQVHHRCLSLRNWSRQMGGGVIPHAVAYPGPVVRHKHTAMRSVSVGVAGWGLLVGGNLLSASGCGCECTAEAGFEFSACLSVRDHVKAPWWLLFSSIIIISDNLIYI